MKMKKKLVSVMLAGAMVFELAACGGKADDAGKDSGSAAGTEAGAAADPAEAAIRERKDSGEYPTITMAISTSTGTIEGSSRVEALISNYTEETYGIKTEILNYDSVNYAQQLQLGFVSGEQIDLFSSIYIGYANSINSKYAYDLEEDDLLQNYGQGIIETVGQANLETCRVNGKIYGIPNMKEFSSGIGAFMIPKIYLDEIGYDYETALAAQGTDRFVLEDTIFADYDVIDDIFAQLHEAYPDKYVFEPCKLPRQVCEVDSVGNDIFGVLFSDSKDLTLENLFENEHWLEYLRHVYQWNQKGYISPDALTDTIDISTIIAAGEALTYISATKPAITKEYEEELGDMIAFMTGDYFSASNIVNNTPWCMGSNCEDPVAAMQLMNAFYTDPVLANLLCWGEEGVDYVLDSDGMATVPEGMRGDDVVYKFEVRWETPNQFLAYIPKGQPADLWEKYDKMNAAAKRSLAEGFVFDNSSVQNEYTALTNVWEEYSAQLMFGFVDPDEKTPELVEKLKAAGLDTYMAEKQRQLDEWAASR